MTKERIYDCATIIIVAILLMLSIASYGQPDSSAKSVVNLQTFTAKQYGNKSYINWTVCSTESNYYFVLEKSTDSMAFEPLSILKGYASPAGVPLLFSVIDVRMNKNIRYRLRAYFIRYEDLDGEKVQVFEVNDVDLFEKSNFSTAILVDMNKVLVSVK